jgi:hypothetical protein
VSRAAAGLPQQPARRRADLAPCLPGFRRKRGREQPGVVGAALVVELAHRGLDLGVAHPRLHLDDAWDVDGQAAEGMAQIVEAQAS